MSTFLIFLSGVVFLAGILFIKPHVKQEKTAKKVIVWSTFVVFYMIIMTGGSFISINASVGHDKAISAAIFLFGGSAVVLGVILARMLNFIGAKKTTESM